MYDCYMLCVLLCNVLALIFARCAKYMILHECIIHKYNLIKGIYIVHNESEICDIFY